MVWDPASRQLFGSLTGPWEHCLLKHRSVLEIGSCSTAHKLDWTVCRANIPGEEGC
jgi:hypothetical protein